MSHQRPPSSSALLEGCAQEIARYRAARDQCMERARAWMTEFTAKEVPNREEQVRKEIALARSFNHSLVVELRSARSLGECS